MLHNKRTVMVIAATILSSNAVFALKKEAPKKENPAVEQTSEQTSEKQKTPAAPQASQDNGVDLTVEATQENLEGLTKLADTVRPKNKLSDDSAKYLQIAVEQTKLVHQILGTPWAIPAGQESAQFLMSASFQVMKNSIALLLSQVGEQAAENLAYQMIVAQQEAVKTKLATTKSDTEQASKNNESEILLDHYGTTIEATGSLLLSLPAMDLGHKDKSIAAIVNLKTEAEKVGLKKLSKAIDDILSLVERHLKEMENQKPEQPQEQDTQRNRGVAPGKSSDPITASIIGKSVRDDLLFATFKK